MAIDDSRGDPTALDETERQALHRVTLGMEWLRRAHGRLLSFHHNTGHAMDHFAAAEQLLDEAGYEELAAAIRTQHLPSGVVDDRWSYDVVETFEEGVLADIEAFEAEAREEIADGRHHVAERVQEQAWRERATDE